MDFEIDNFIMEICPFCSHADCTCDDYSFEDIQELMREVIEEEVNIDD